MPDSQLGIVSYQITDIGRKKPNNEDYVGSFEPDDPEERATSGCLYLLADGVGGGVRGEKASQYAVQKVLYEYYRLSESDLAARLRETIAAANADIYHYAEENHSLSMGTTLVAAAVRGQELVAANVGDSRAYLIREGHGVQITRDHSLVQMLLDTHQLTQEEAKNFKRKNVILRSAGADETVEIDIFRETLRPGDAVLLCSDGLHKYFPDTDELAKLVGEGTPEQAGQALLRLANERGGSDNISLILISFEKAEANAGPEKKKKPRGGWVGPVLGLILAAAGIFWLIFVQKGFQIP